MSTLLVLETNSVGNGVKALRIAKELGLRTHFVTRWPGEYAAQPVRPTDIADEVAIVLAHKGGARGKPLLDR